MLSIIVTMSSNYAIFNFFGNFNVTTLFNLLIGMVVQIFSTLALGLLGHWMFRACVLCTLGILGWNRIGRAFRIYVSTI